jgi:hypothetical protein
MMEKIMDKNIKSFWELIKEYKIDIPIIQRDYVQGRANEKKRRDEFLKVIYNTLINVTQPNLNLDFIYGRVYCIKNESGEITERKFSPIDGQQRLTTLFLLHWYVAKKEHIGTEEVCVLENFTYNTRISSREFCKALVRHISDIELPETGKFKSHIVNCSWYRTAWDADPTIQSMLTMLESIHEKFYNTDHPLWDTLKTRITFQLLDLGEKGFELTDELYIKMNARGKQLTDFENFKAWFIAFLEKKHSSKDGGHEWLVEINPLKPTHNDYFSYQIETEWTDLFWAYHDEKTYTIDSQFMNFFNFIAQMCYFKGNLGKKAEDFKAHDFSLVEEIFSDENNVRFLFEALNWFYKLGLEGNLVKKEKINAFFASFLGEGRLNLFEDSETNLFEKCIYEGEKFDNRNRIILYCIIHYVMKYKLTDTVNDGLRYYIRVVRNLLQATRQLNEIIYNSNVRINDFSSYWKVFEQLAQENVYDFLSNQDIEIFSGNERQLKEEKIKAEIFVSGSEETKKAIFELEEFGALNGLIHQFKPSENKDKLTAYSKIIPEIWNDKLSASLVIRAMIASGFDGFYTKPCALGDMYFYGGKKPQANYNKWTTVLTNNDTEISYTMLSLLDKYLEEDVSFSPEQKLHCIITKRLEEYLKNDVPRDRWYYFLKYPAMSDNTWDYGEYCYYAWADSQYECERLTSVSSNPLLGWHINVFNISVYKKLKELNIDDYCPCNNMWAIYSDLSDLRVKNGMSLSCKGEGWKIKIGEFPLSTEIRNEFAIADDLILKEKNGMDRVEIAVEFIKKIGSTE